LGQKILLPLPHKLAEAKKIKMLRSYGKRKLRVTATAYSSHRAQTDKTPFLAAWNNRLRPGMKIIAVSRDMLTRYGMRNGTRVRIAGLPGIYRVRDKMNKRYRKRIDIYMGVNRRKALRWGRRSVVIYW
jgi:3D (Asp-Asp-Asp) domain-containing protein